ncbi:MAG: LytR family transcriptional regulator [Anaerolineaceae bacterium]|nr:LCP family protein [Chloroflexota bacterium]RJP47044.1 MAG: LytR family transcriptional regulator [Anaerolineaceae bacterium]
MPGSRTPNMYHPFWRSLAYWIFVTAAMLAAFFIVRKLTLCWTLTALPGVPPAECAFQNQSSSDLPALPDPATANNLPVELSAPEMELPKWDGASRINIAFFGLRGDDGQGEGCPTCTDTIMVLTVDPVTKTAGMLSIPRDMWVNIPGAGYSRINTAWAIGENAKLPGGGPQLAMQTVSQFIGVPIHYYVQVDFGTFVSFINLIGGIDVYVEERMVLDPLGAGQDHFVLKPGDYRHLTGPRALAYARCRHESQGCSGGDVGRAKRQQQVILAIRDKVLEGETFATLITQAPQLYAEFSSGIHTNLSLEDAIQLAVLAKDIRVDDIKRGVIDSTMANPADTTINGVQANVLRPVPDLIRILRDEIFVPGGPLSPMAQGDPVALMQSDQAKVRIINNTYTAGLEQRTATLLTAQGMQVVEYGVPTGASNTTKIILYSSKLYALRYLTELLGVGSQQITIQPNPASTVDMEIRLGEDWVGRVPSGY